VTSQTTIVRKTTLQSRDRVDQRFPKKYRFCDRYQCLISERPDVKGKIAMMKARSNKWAANRGDLLTGARVPCFGKVAAIYARLLLHDRMTKG
jgi:hypothetical protein